VQGTRENSNSKKLMDRDLNLGRNDGNSRINYLVSFYMQMKRNFDGAR